MEEKLDNATIPNQYTLCLDRQCPKASTCLRQLAERSMPDETAYWQIISPRHLASLKGTCPYYRPNKKVRYAAGFVSLLESLPHKQMLSVIPGLYEALQPAHLLPRPQGRKAALTLRATGRIECAQTLWGEGAKRFRRLFRGVRLVNQGREACATTHVTNVPSPWHACAIAVARLCHRGGTGVPAWWHNCANSMAHHWHHKVLLIKQLE